MLTPAIWTAMYMHEPLPQALASLCAAGWRSFECSSEHLVEIDQSEAPAEHVAAVKQALADLKAEMPQAHALLQANIAHPDPEKRESDLATLERHLRLSAAMGVRNVVVHPAGVYTNADELRTVRAQNMASLRRLADVAGELGLRIGVENMPARREGKHRFGAAVDELVDLLAEMDHPALGITVDTDHLVSIGADAAAAIRKFGPYLVATHISDADGAALSHRTPGRGVIDWPAAVRALKETGYKGIFNLEIPGERVKDLEQLAKNTRVAYEVTVKLLQDA